MTVDAELRLAAFGEGSIAVAAWRKWEKGRVLDPHALDPLSMRLFPAVYRNLRQAGIADEEIAAVIKQMTRSTWIRTRLLLRQAAETVRLFQGCGIASILLKGAALMAAGYCNAQWRPMSDFDLLVRPEDAVRAAGVLSSSGWSADAPVDAASIASRHAALFKRGETSCDLHWWALWDVRDHAGDARIRAHAQPAMLDGVRVLVPRAEHQLIHVILHGTRAFDETSIRWIGDALAVVRARPLDWALFRDDVIQLGASYPIGEALAYLANTYGAPIPTPVIEALRFQHVSRTRRRLYAPNPDAPRRDNSLAFADSLLHLARRQRSVLWLLRNLQYTLREQSLARVPAALVRRIARLVKRRWS